MFFGTFVITTLEMYKIVEICAAHSICGEGIECTKKFLRPRHKTLLILTESSFLFLLTQFCDLHKLGSVFTVQVYPGPQEPQPACCPAPL